MEDAEDWEKDRDGGWGMGLVVNNVRTVQPPSWVEKPAAVVLIRMRKSCIKCWTSCYREPVLLCLTIVAGNYPPRLVV